MTGFRAKALLASVSLTALLCAGAAAQDPPADVTGPPRALRPSVDSGPSDLSPVPVETTPSADAASPAPDAGPERAAPAATSVLGNRNSAVEVGALSTLEGPLAGSLEGPAGLGPSEWTNSTDRASIDAMLASMPASGPSPLHRQMVRALLLTRASPPPGKGDTAFNALRIRKLLEGGLISDAADLGAEVRVKDDALTARLQADALLYAGRDMDACGDATTYRLQSGDEFWIELRTFCYVLSGDQAALDLTRAVMAAQALKDPAFDAALDVMTGGKSKAPDVVTMASALIPRMFGQLKWPLPANFTTEPSLPGTLAVMRSAATPVPLRLAAAQTAFKAGALAGADLAAALDLYTFKPADLQAAPAQARAEDMMRGLARLRAALKGETRPEQRAEIIYTAFRIGESQGILPLVAQLFATDAAAIMPSHEWNNWAPTLAKGLILAGRPSLAERWYVLLDSDLPTITEARRELDVALGIALPDGTHADSAQTALSALVTNPGVPASRAALEIGLTDALGRPIPADARAQLGQLLDSGASGRRPPKALLTRIDEASLKDRRGDLVLAVITAIGPQGPSDMASDVVVGMVRALRTAGLGDLARALAIEALVGA